MLAKEDKIQFRVNYKVKKEAEKILTKLGITPSQAFNMFYHQIIINKGMPFGLKAGEKYEIATPELEKLIAQGVRDYHSGRYKTIDLDNEEELDRILKIK